MRSRILGSIVCALVVGTTTIAASPTAQLGGDGARRWVGQRPRRGVDVNFPALSFLWAPLARRMASSVAHGEEPNSHASELPPLRPNDRALDDARRLGQLFTPLEELGDIVRKLLARPRVPHASLSGEDVASVHV